MEMSNVVSLSLDKTFECAALKLNVNNVIYYILCLYRAPLSKSKSNRSNRVYKKRSTHIHTYIHTDFFIRYLSSVCSKTDFSTNIFSTMNVKNFCPVTIYLFD